MSAVRCLSRRLASGETFIGTFLQTPHPVTGEFLAGLGFDVVCVDAEHSAVNPETLPALVAAVELGGSIPLVRVAENRVAAVAAALDAGAAGVVVPRVESAEQAAAAVAAARFPPAGARGVGPGRAAGYGRRIPEHLARAADETLVAVQVETRAGLEAASSIAQVAGVDLVFVGPGDLAASLGLEPGPALEESIGAISDAARAAGRFTGIFAPSATVARARLDQGYDLVVVGSELAFAAEAAAATMRALRPGSQG